MSRLCWNICYSSVPSSQQEILMSPKRNMTSDLNTMRILIHSSSGMQSLKRILYYINKYFILIYSLKKSLHNSCNDRDPLPYFLIINISYLTLRKMMTVMSYTTDSILNNFMNNQRHISTLLTLTWVCVKCLTCIRWCLILKKMSYEHHFQLQSYILIQLLLKS